MELKNYNLNITSKEILSKLQEIDFKTKVIENLKKTKFSYNKSDIYEEVESIAIDTICKVLNINNYDIFSITHLRYGNGNVKRRYVSLEYKYDNNNTFYLLTIYCEVSCKKNKLDDWIMSDLDIFISDIDKQKENTSIIDLINENIYKLNEHHAYNDTVAIPEHISKTKILFDKIIELMENRNEIDWRTESDLKDVIKEYNDLRK